MILKFFLKRENWTSRKRALRHRMPNLWRESAFAARLPYGGWSALPVAELDQLFAKRAPFKATIDLHPVIVREEQDLTSRLCRDQGIPAQPKRELDHAGQLHGFAGFKSMSGSVIESTVLALGAPPPPVLGPLFVVCQVGIHPSPLTQNRNCNVASVNAPAAAAIAFAASA